MFVDVCRTVLATHVFLIKIWFVKNNPGGTGVQKKLTTAVKEIFMQSNFLEFLGMVCTKVLRCSSV